MRVAVLALAAGLLLLPSTAAASGPSLRVTPAVVAPAGSLTITGFGWSSRTVVTLAAGHAESEADRIRTVQTDTRGAFRVSIRLNGSAKAGRYVLLACASGCRTKASAGFEVAALVARTSLESPFRVWLPAGWRYRDSTFPSDHTLEYWTNPADSLSRLKVQASTCVGCVQKRSCAIDGSIDCPAAPENVLPENTVSRTRLDEWRLAFVAYTSDNRYPDRGLVLILHEGRKIQGFIRVELWLPPEKKGLAAAILDSFSA